MNYPAELFIAAATAIALVIEAIYRIRRIWAIPALLVYVSILAWYVGDLAYYGIQHFRSSFGPNLVRLALWQVVIFLVVYRAFVHWLLPERDDPRFHLPVVDWISQKSLRALLGLILVAWVGLLIVGLVRAEGDFEAILWPPVRQLKVSMFATSGVGSGADFLISAAGYLYLLVCSLFGVVLVLSRRWMTILCTFLVCISWPYFWFDRARNVMLAVLLPGMFCYWVGTRVKLWQKILLSAVLFVGVNIWFLQVMHYRAEGTDDLTTFLDFDDYEEETHLGLDMLSELCSIDGLMELGYYSPTWGGRYFAEVAQIIPRTLWPNKPMIGIDYAIARGFGAKAAEGNDAGVYATVSTGVIGQGVANFGLWLGVIAAALLMALWTKILAKQWMRRFELPHFLLFAVGCGLTFNMGRDITLLVLWPFAFAYCVVFIIEKWQGSEAEKPSAGIDLAVNETSSDAILSP